MTNKRVISYGRAYRFGTDGSAALAATPVYSRETAPVRRDTLRREGQARPVPGKRQKPRGLSVPVWLVIVAMAGCLFAAAMSMLVGRSQVTAMSKQLSSMKLELAQIEQINQGLEVQIEAAADPERIRSLALNRLGMSMPSEDRIYRVAAPAAAVHTHTVEWPQREEETSLLQILLSSLTDP